MRLRSMNPVLRDDIYARARTSGGEVMTFSGTVNKCIALLGICIITAMLSWDYVSSNPQAMMLMSGAGLIGGLIFALATIFKPTLAPITAPLYAAFEGLILGSISMFFEQRFPGIVFQAILATFGVLGVLLLIYRTGIIKVTQKFLFSTFLNKRKTLRNGLKSLYSLDKIEEVFNKFGWGRLVRAEELDVDHWPQLYRELRP